MYSYKRQLIMSTRSNQSHRLSLIEEEYVDMMINLFNRFREVKRFKWRFDYVRVNDMTVIARDFILHISVLSATRRIC